MVKLMFYPLTTPFTEKRVYQRLAPVQPQHLRLENWSDFVGVSTLCNATLA